MNTCVHWTFDIYTDNNPLTYVLTTAKLDAASHPWVASLANHNFQLYYKARKTNIDADALLRVFWPGCMADHSGTHLKVTAAAVQAMQEATLKGIEAYSCNMHILDAVQDSHQVACVILDDWCQAKQADPTLSEVISRLWDGTLGQQQSKLTDPAEVSPVPAGTKPSFTQNRASCTEEPDPGNQRRPSFSWCWQPHRKRLL